MGCLFKLEQQVANFLFLHYRGRGGYSLANESLPLMQVQSYVQFLVFLLFL